MNVIVPKIAVKRISAAKPFIFITKTIAAMARAISMQKTSMVGASNNPIRFFFNKKIPVKTKAGKHIAKSKT